MLGGYPAAFFMPIKIFYKILGGDPPAFIMPKKIFFKMLGGYPPAFLPQIHSIKAWWVSTSLFYV